MSSVLSTWQRPPHQLEGDRPEGLTTTRLNEGARLESWFRCVTVDAADFCSGWYVRLLRRCFPVLSYARQPYCLYKILWRMGCMMERHPYNTGLGSHQYGLAALGLAHKATPFFVDIPVEWNHPATRASWRCIATRRPTLRLDRVINDGSWQDSVTLPSRKPIDESLEPAPHGSFSCAKLRRL
jgi:hypothetical protein